MSLNQMQLIGHLGKDPELRHTQKGQAVCTVSLATSYKTKGGEERVTWHRVVAWDGHAENLAKYTQKGSQVWVEGRMDYRPYTDSQGIKRVQAEVVVSRVEFLSGKPGKKTDEAQTELPLSEGDVPVDESDMPF